MVIAEDDHLKNNCKNLQMTLLKTWKKVNKHNLVIDFSKGFAMVSDSFLLHNGIIMVYMGFKFSDHNFIYVKMYKHQ